MNRFFDMDNPVLRFLSRMADLMILNILALLLCIPVVTAGASLTAMLYVELKWVRKQEGYTVRPFFQQFKANFKQATGEWLLMLLVGLILYMDISMFRNTEEGTFPFALQVIVVVVGIVLYLMAQWIFPLQCHFENTVKQTLQNSALMAIANFPRTLGMGAVWIASVLLLFVSLTILPPILPISALFGLSLPGLAVCALASKPFRQFEPEEEEPTEEENEADKEEAYRILREENAIVHEETSGPDDAADGKELDDHRNDGAGE